MLNIKRDQMESAILSDRELIDLYLSGHLSSLENLIHRHKDKVYSYIVMVVRDTELADDLFQDTFIKVINTLRSGSYKEEGKFIQWVMRIAHNLIIDHFRKSKRLPVVDNNSEDFDIFDTIGQMDGSVEDKMITEQIYDDVRKLIEYLPKEQREVLIMRHYADMSFKDIAEVTDVSINTALGRMRYALINLRKLIREKDIILTL
jgi:RNA polymerase sigma factor (sigma-70 family)